MSGVLRRPALLASRPEAERDLRVAASHHTLELHSLDHTLPQFVLFLLKFIVPPMGADSRRNGLDRSHFPVWVRRHH